jgi:group I intron endonuclease
MSNIIKSSGVYKITNEVTGKFYIGSSKQIEQRFIDHQRDLKKGNHDNQILQNAWNFYGGDKFTFMILEECDATKCIEREQHYLDLLQPYKNVGYNIGKTAKGGDNFVNHPNKEEIREKTRLQSTGENNGMFGQTHTPEALAKLKAAAKGRFSLSWFIERNGTDIGTQKYQERRTMLANRKINYVYDNGLKGKKVVVEADRGTKISAGRKALKSRVPQFLLDLNNEFMSNKQISEEYGISTAAVKYHRNKKPSK